MEEDQALEWENNEHEENGGNMTWILNKGWSVGKKMLITGVVISSAPFILPPLMFILTLGLFCAVPFGFILATYICTEKLIATLLPCPKASPVTYEDSKAKDNYEEYGGDVDVANEEEELRRRVDIRLEQDEKENYEGGVKDKDETVSKDVLVEEGEKPKEETPGVNEELVKETTGNVDGVDTKETETETSHVKKNEESGTQSGNGEGGNTKETKANRAKKNRKVKSADAAEGNKKPGLKDIGETASKEAVYSEEDIWKQIDAMRGVVGYTETRLRTCIDELKALYVFTGVEPPASFKDPSDLEEINHKLRFLMSVVGVE